MTVCSVLIPTRQRFDGLLRAVKSTFATATDVEVLIRTDYDDQETLDRLPELDCFGPRVRINIGHRLLGYGSVNVFFTELALMARGDWISIFNDDSWFEGSDWDHELTKLPIRGFIAHPEIVGNGPCRYSRSEGGPFPIVPTRCWEQYGWPGIKQPADIELDLLLRHQQGWKSHFLNGMTILHERDQAFMERRQGELRDPNGADQ